MILKALGHHHHHPHIKIPQTIVMALIFFFHTSTYNPANSTRVVCSVYILCGGVTKCYVIGAYCLSRWNELYDFDARMNFWIKKNQSIIRKKNKCTRKMLLIHERRILPEQNSWNGIILNDISITSFQSVPYAWNTCANTFFRERYNFETYIFTLCASEKIWYTSYSKTHLRMQITTAL